MRHTPTSAIVFRFDDMADAVRSVPTRNLCNLENRVGGEAKVNVSACQTVGGGRFSIHIWGGEFTGTGSRFFTKIKICPATLCQGHQKFTFMSREMARFSPKQCLPKNADLYVEIVGDSTSGVAEHFLSLIPPLPSKSLSHDNGCSEGEITTQIMASNPAANIDIYATRIDPTRSINVGS